MKNLFLPVMVVLLVAACGPRDVLIGGDRGVNGQNVDVNAYTVVQKDGELSSTCKKGKAFTTIDSPVQYDQMIFSGKVTAQFQAGDQNCFRIGDVIDLQDRNGGPSRGKVKILKAESFHISKLTAAHAAAFNTSLNDLIARVQAELARVKAIPKGEPGGFNPRDMVSITYFEYLGFDGNVPSGPVTGSDVHIVVETVGELASTCKSGKAYTTMNSPTQSDSQVFAGKVTAAFEVGDRNCFRIGDIVTLQNGLNGEPRGKVKVTKAEVLHYTKLTSEHAKAFSVPLVTLETRVKAELDRVKAIPKGEPGGFDPKGMVSITYFQYVNEDGTTPVTPPVVTNPTDPTTPPVTPTLPSNVITEVTAVGTMAVTCPANFTPQKSIDISQDKDEQIKSGALMGFMAPGDRNCFQIGSVVSLKAKPKVKGEVTPERAKLKIAWVEIIPVDLLNNNHAVIMNMTLPELKDAAAKSIAGVPFDAKNTVTITVFEYIPEVIQ